jgi:adenylate kinase family enzyme
MKILILGNSGSGKSTLATKLAAARGGKVAVLALDQIAWEKEVTRRALEDCATLIREFIRNHDDWILEGCYADLIEIALPFCDELVFLNPGIEACLRQARTRDWEPEKFRDKHAQDAMLETLLEWIQTYETRTDEFGLSRHRALFDGFASKKREFTSPDEYRILPQPASSNHGTGRGN